MLFYCYDAYCGWCYAFSPIMKKINAEFGYRVDLEVLSGGMIISDKPKHISLMAGYIQQEYPQVEEYTGVKFGADYLWHINNPDLSDWYPSSEKPAIALCVFKHFYPERQISFASDMQYALHFEGRDLDDDESYLHLLDRYSIQPDVFIPMLKSETFKERAHDEFALCRRLQVSGYPAVLLQLSDTKFHLLARGYTNHEILKERLEQVLEDIGQV